MNSNKESAKTFESYDNLVFAPVNKSRTHQFTKSRSSRAGSWTQNPPKSA